MFARTCFNASLRTYTYAAKTNMVWPHHYLQKAWPRINASLRVGIVGLDVALSKAQSTSSITNANQEQNDNGVRDRLLEKITTGRIGQYVSAFEEFLGIGDVKRAQTKLIQLEEKFMDARTNVKQSNSDVDRLQGDLRTIRSKLDRTPRDDPIFLELATEEHHLLQAEIRLQEHHAKHVANERMIFQEMGAAMRENYEKQRVQEERSKYWSLMVGLATGIIAFIGSSIINHRRMRTVQRMVLDQIHAISGESPVGDSKDLGTALKSTTNTQHVSLEAQSKTFKEFLDKQEKQFGQELSQMKKMLVASGSRDPGMVEDILSATQAKLEWEVKMSALSTVVLIYGAFALTLPILYSIFK